MNSALGTVFTVKTPIGNQAIDVPVDQIAKAVVDAAWPPFRAHIEAEVPVLVNKAWPPLKSRLEAETPVLVQKALPTLRTEEKSLLSKVNRTAFLLGATVVGTVAVGVFLVRR